MNIGPVFIEHAYDYFCDRCRLRIQAGEPIAMFPRSNKGFCEGCADRLQQKRFVATSIQSAKGRADRRYTRDERRWELWGVWEWKFDHPPARMRSGALRWLWDRHVMRERRRVVLSRTTEW